MFKKEYSISYGKVDLSDETLEALAIGRRPQTESIQSVPTYHQVMAIVREDTGLVLVIFDTAEYDMYMDKHGLPGYAYDGGKKHFCLWEYELDQDGELQYIEQHCGGAGERVGLEEAEAMAISFAKAG